MIDLQSFNLVRLDPIYEILPFECGDIDLNEFLIKDSKPYSSELLAVTYIFEGANNNTVAFFSVLNDKVSVADAPSNTQWKKRFKARFSDRKQFTSYPAVKIGRLAVSKLLQGQGMGTAMLDYIKYMFITNNRTGCRFITVDAYSGSLKFYENNGFKYMTEGDLHKDTRLMYFDLAVLKESFEQQEALDDAPPQGSTGPS
jgi:GNAT superfamily N-acetyltransferase